MNHVARVSQKLNELEVELELFKTTVVQIDIVGGSAAALVVWLHAY